MVQISGSLCAVSGGAGFIGSTLALELLRQGAHVRVLDNLSMGKQSNLSPHEQEIEFFKLDIRDLDAVEKALAGCDFVFHLAAVNSVPLSFECPELTLSTNVMGTLNLLMASLKQGVKKLVSASSSSVYGGIKEEMKRETLPAQPISPYAISKYAGELLVKNYAEAFGLPTVSLRYFNVYGPRQALNSPYAAVIPKFVGALLKHEAPTVYGDGTQARDFTYVGNVAHATILALLKGKSGDVYNVGEGALTNLNELLEELYKIIGIKILPVYSAWRKGDVYRSGADIAKAKSELGYKGNVGLREGLSMTVDWFKREQN